MEDNEKAPVPCRAVNLDGDWFVVPAGSYEAILKDNEAVENEQMDGGDFDEKWGHYRTGGCLSHKTLFAHFD